MSLIFCTLFFLKGIVEYCLGEPAAVQWFMIAGIWYIGWKIPPYIKPSKDDLVVGTGSED